MIAGDAVQEFHVGRPVVALPPVRSAEPPRHPFRMLLQGVFDGEDIGEGEPDDDEPATGAVEGQTGSASEAAG